MTNNLEIIKPLLKWETPDEYYLISVIQRKKDHLSGMKVNGTNNNARLIKAYYVKSLEHLHFIMPEIIELCKVFNARAGINLNKRSFEKTAFQNLKLVSDNIMNRNFDKVYKTYSSAAGKFSHDNYKKWIVDVDKEDLPFLIEIKLAIDKCEPNLKWTRIIAEIPSKSGLHLITSPFNRAEFPKLLDQLMEKYSINLRLDIQTNNPTSLYIP